MVARCRDTRGSRPVGASGATGLRGEPMPLCGVDFGVQVPGSTCPERGYDGCRHRQRTGRMLVLSSTSVLPGAPDGRVPGGYPAVDFPIDTEL